MRWVQVNWDIFISFHEKTSSMKEEEKIESGKNKFFIFDNNTSEKRWEDSPPSFLLLFPAGQLKLNR